MIENDRESRSPPKSSHQHIDAISSRILAGAVAPPYPVPMERKALNKGTRAEILGELEQYGSDRAQQGKEEKARAYARAWHAVEGGAVEVEVEHAVYRVVED